MSIASQQRVIEEHQATIRALRNELAQAKADARDSSHVYDALTALCDEYEVAGLKAVPVATLRHLRPKGHGVDGGRASSVEAALSGDDLAMREGLIDRNPEVVEFFKERQAAFRHRYILGRELSLYRLVSGKRPEAIEVRVTPFGLHIFDDQHCFRSYKWRIGADLFHSHMAALTVARSYNMRAGRKIRRVAWRDHHFAVVEVPSGVIEDERPTCPNPENGHRFPGTQPGQPCIYCGVISTKERPDNLDFGYPGTMKGGSATSEEGDPLGAHPKELHCAHGVVLASTIGGPSNYCRACEHAGGHETAFVSCHAHPA